MERVRDETPDLASRWPPLSRSNGPIVAPWWQTSPKSYRGFQGVGLVEIPLRDLSADPPCRPLILVSQPPTFSPKLCFQIPYRKIATILRDLTS